MSFGAREVIAILALSLLSGCGPLPLIAIGAAASVGAFGGGGGHGGGGGNFSPPGPVPVTPPPPAPPPPPVPPPAPGAPSRISVVSGDGQFVLEGTSPSPLVALVTDAAGIPVPNVPVSFAVISGSATVSAPSATGANGEISCAVAFVATGTVTVNATATGLRGSPLTYHLGELSAPRLTETARMTIGVRPEALAVGCLDSDPFPDFAVGLTASATIALVRGDGVGGLLSTVVTLKPSSSVLSLAFGDLNKDGRLDVVSADVSNGTVSVFVNATPAGDPSLAFGSPIGLRAPRPCSVQCIDLDGDGLADVVVGGLDGTTSVATLFLNTTSAGAATPTFSTSTLVGRSGLSGGNYVGATAVDLNRDGVVDVALTHNLNDPSIAVFLGTTAPGGPLTFAPPVFIPATGQAQEIHACDLDRDGAADLLTTDLAANEFSYVNRTPARATSPSFSGPIATPAACQNLMQTLATGDLNGDGIPDLALVDRGNGGAVVVWVGTGTGTFAGPVTLAGTGPRPGAVAIADVNLDGKLDVVVAGGGSSDPTQPGQLIIFVQK